MSTYRFDLLYLLNNKSGDRWLILSGILFSQRYKAKEDEEVSYQTNQREPMRVDVISTSLIDTTNPKLC